MKNTRRSFFSWTRNALAAAGAMGTAPAMAAEAAAGEDYYAKLGVTKIINAAGTYTALTASTMPPSVLATVTASAHHPVRLAELQQKSGE
jgi:L-seryl-tRNA(Ser) seleniumtransferase